MVTTKLIELLNDEGVYPQNWTSGDDVDQVAVDRVSASVLSQLTADDIATHNIAAYSNSVEEYRNKQANSLAVPELPHFINLMPNDGLVLDIASGHMRDPLYMINPESRDVLNREGMVSPPVNKRLNVIVHDGSYQFLDSCVGRLDGNMSRVPLIVYGDYMTPGVGSVYHSSDKKLENMFAAGGKFEPVLDGIWSCAGLMVHLVPEKFEETISGWSEALKPGGIFAVSYIKRKDGQLPIKLLASRSAPGEIKVFSHYAPNEVDEAFEKAGMRLIDMTSGDYDGHGHVMTDFFGSSMYRKE